MTSSVSCASWLAWDCFRLNVDHAELVGLQGWGMSVVWGDERWIRRSEGVWHAAVPLRGVIAMDAIGVMFVSRRSDRSTSS